MKKRSLLSLALATMLILAMATSAFAAGETVTHNVGDHYAANPVSITNVIAQKGEGNDAVFNCEAPVVITLMPLTNGEMSYLYDFYATAPAGKEEPVRVAKYYHDYFNDKQKYDSEPTDEAVIWAYADGTYITLAEEGEYTINWVNADVEDLAGSFTVIVGDVESSGDVAEAAPEVAEEVAPVIVSVPISEPEPAPAPAPTVQTIASTATLKTTANLVKEVPPVPVAGQDLAYKVQKGERLWSIAYNYYGSMSDATVIKIKSANSDYFKKTKGILEAGATITLPAKGLINPVTQSSLDKAAGMYMVKSGDTLAGIAKTYYGDAKQWEKIYEANKDRVKMVGKSPMIYEGQWLVIPQ